MSGETNNDMTKSTAQSKPAGQSLDDLAKTIKSEHSAIVAQMTGKGLVEKAIKLGEALIQAKEQVGHGEFIKWVADNCNVKKRTAQRYMRLVEHRAKIDKHCKDKHVTLTFLSLSEAYELTKEQKQTTTTTGGTTTAATPTSTATSDDVDAMVDALVAKLKVMMKDRREEAEDAVKELVEKLELLDLLSETPLKKAA
jgi:hypothetical protein